MQGCELFIGVVYGSYLYEGIVAYFNTVVILIGVEFVNVVFYLGVSREYSSAGTVKVLYCLAVKINYISVLACDMFVAMMSFLLRQM